MCRPPVEDALGKVISVLERQNVSGQMNKSCTCRAQHVLTRRHRPLLQSDLQTYQWFTVLISQFLSRVTSLAPWVM
jgi:hypothetical protein